MGYRGDGGQISGYKKDIEARSKVIRDNYEKLEVNTKKLDEKFKEYGGKIR